MNKDILSKFFSIANKTIGSELVGTKVDNNANLKMYKELCESLIDIIEEKHILKDNEYLSQSYDLLNKKWKYRINIKQPMIDKTKTYTLSDEDKSILRSHGIDETFPGDIGISNIDDNILIVRTPDYTWSSLCGREWHYNLTTKEWKLALMN